MRPPCASVVASARGGPGGCRGAATPPDGRSGRTRNPASQRKGGSGHRSGRATPAERPPAHPKETPMTETTTIDRTPLGARAALRRVATVGAVAALGLLAPA